MVIEVLKQRRESIVADIRQLRDSLHHLDEVIKMFEGGTVKPRRKRGETTRAVLDVLRNSDRRMTATEIATALKTDVQHIRLALTQQRAKGVLRKDDAEAWEIVK